MQHVHGTMILFYLHKIVWLENNRSQYNQCITIEDKTTSIAAIKVYISLVFLSFFSFFFFFFSFFFFILFFVFVLFGGGG